MEYFNQQHSFAEIIKELSCTTEPVHPDIEKEINLAYRHVTNEIFEYILKNPKQLQLHLAMIREELWGLYVEASQIVSRFDGFCIPFGIWKRRSDARREKYAYRVLKRIDSIIDFLLNLESPVHFPPFIEKTQ